MKANGYCGHTLKEIAEIVGDPDIRKVETKFYKYLRKKGLFKGRACKMTPAQFGEFIFAYIFERKFGSVSEEFDGEVY